MGQFAKITQVTSPHLDTYLNEMSKWGEVNSLFYCTDENYLQFGGEVRFKELCSFIEQVESITECDSHDKLTYTVLNRLEFLGSIATKYVQGGIYGRPTSDSNEALAFVSNLIDEIFPFDEQLVSQHGYDDFFAYKIENDQWCNLLDGMRNWSYVVNDFHNHRWWFVYYNSSS